MISDIFIMEELFTFLDLKGYGGSFGGKVAASSCTAKNAAPDAAGPVTVWTGHSGIKGNLVYFLTIFTFEYIIKRMIAFVVTMQNFI